MYLSQKLSFYIGRRFLNSLFVTIFGLTTIVFVFDFIELLRRSANKDSATFDIILQMSFLKLPHMIELLIPFAVLFGAMATFFRLTKTQELIIARSAGISVWQFMLPAATIAFSLGVFLIVAFNPLASTFLSKFDQMEARYLRGNANQITFLEDAVWLRQSVGNKQAVIYAEGLSQQDLVLSSVTIYQFKDQDTFVDRLDAEVAFLGDGYWQLENVRQTLSDGRIIFKETDTLPTNLSKENILDSFASPETLSFWQLPNFINLLETAGFSALRHKLHLNSLITIPILLCAMVLIAASFSLRPPRRGQTLSMVIGGLFTGFCLFFMNDLVSALGLSSKIPLLMAAWTPTLVAVLFGVAFLLHMEDG